MDKHSQLCAESRNYVKGSLSSSIVGGYMYTHHPMPSSIPTNKHTKKSPKVVTHPTPKYLFKGWGINFSLNLIPLAQ